MARSSRSPIPPRPPTHKIPGPPERMTRVAQPPARGGGGGGERQPRGRVQQVAHGPGSPLFARQQSRLAQLQARGGGAADAFLAKRSPETRKALMGLQGAKPPSVAPTPTPVPTPVAPGAAPTGPGAAPMPFPSAAGGGGFGGGLGAGLTAPTGAGAAAGPGMIPGVEQAAPGGMMFPGLGGPTPEVMGRRPLGQRSYPPLDSALMGLMSVKGRLF